MNRHYVDILLLACLIMTGCSGSSGGDTAGLPFSATTQSDFAQMADMQGWVLDATAETGRCDIIRQVVENMPSGGSGTLSQANAEAATSPNGSLFVTVEMWTDGNPEALEAVQSCTDYIVGTRYGE